MKTNNLIKIAAVVLLGIAVSGKVQADNEKYSRTSRVAVKQMIHFPKVTGLDFPDMERYFSQPVEGWMFESEYLSEESTGAIESWMLETDYLDEEVQPLENWMFDDSRLDETVSNTSLEPWMLEGDYLSR